MAKELQLQVAWAVCINTQISKSLPHKKGRLFCMKKEIIMSTTKETKGKQRTAKNGIIYIILAFFLCTIGIHNFYAGYIKRGFAQIILTITSPFFMFIPLIIVSLWGLGEILFENKDVNNIPFKGNKQIILGLRVLSIFALIYSLFTTELIL